MLFQMTADWVRAACPDPDVQQQLIQHVERALALDVNCSAIIGAALTRRGKGLLFHCYSNELFTFQLTDEQARSLEVRDDMTVLVTGRDRDPPGIAGTSLFLTRFEIDHADGLDRHAPFTGRYAYHTSWKSPVSCMLRLDFELPDGCCGFRWQEPVRALPPSGQHEFSFESFFQEGYDLSEEFTGPLVVFFTVFARIKPGCPDEPQLISDVGGTLVIIR